MALHCPGKSDYSCPHWDHLVRLTVCCDKENPLCGEELGRWITPYRRSVYRTYNTNRRGLTIRQRQRSLRNRLPIPFFETISWLSQVAQLLKKREFMLEMKKGACARVQAEMVGFIALRFPFSKKPAGLKCRSQVTGQVTGHRLQATGHKSQVRLQATGHTKKQ